MSDPHGEIDRILDEALAGYSSEEPRPGLERRVLATVLAEGRARAREWWRWVAIVPVLAGLWAAAIVFREKPQPVKKSAVVEPTALGVSALPVPQTAARKPRKAARRVSHEASRVRPSLSADERALVQLVMHFPEQAQIVLSEPDRPAIQPIEIEKIEIAPLPVGSQQ